MGRCSMCAQLTWSHLHCPLLLPWAALGVLLDAPGLKGNRRSRAWLFPLKREWCRGWTWHTKRSLWSAHFYWQQAEESSGQVEGLSFPLPSNHSLQRLALHPCLGTDLIINSEINSISRYCSMGLDTWTILALITCLQHNTKSRREGTLLNPPRLGVNNPKIAQASTCLTEEWRDPVPTQNVLGRILYLTPSLVL